MNRSALSTIPVSPGEPDRRARMVAAVVDLCEAAPRGRSTAADAALSQVVLPLVAKAEREVRQRLAERLAAVDWAPHDLVAALALDEIEVARPLLALSPILVDDDFLRVLAQAGVDHRIEVARRPALSETVADRVSADVEPLVLAALASNEHTQLPGSAVRRLVEASRRTASLRGPLAQRRDLDPEQALQLYAFVGESLRRSLVQRFDLPPARLAEVMAEAVSEARSGTSIHGDREEMEHRLVEKLQASGQLRPGFLVKSLRDGRLGLFEEALGALSGLPRTAVAVSLRESTPEPLALACAAAGLDRGAFPTILTLVRRETMGLPGDAPDSILRVKAAFATSRPVAAAHAMAMLGARAS